MCSPEWRSCQRFEVDIPENVLQNLSTLLRLSRLPEESFENLQLDRRYGITLPWMKNAKDIWETHFDWRKHERCINRFPQYITRVVDDDGREYDIHFAALFSDQKKAIPILLLHGWPGSFLEFLPMLDMVNRRLPRSESPYHLIAPSLVGYAFSSKPPLNKDSRIENGARILDRFMDNLGFGTGYVVHGGDLGSDTARVMGATHASCKGESRKAVHINFCYMPEPSMQKPLEVDDLDRVGIERSRNFESVGNAYAKEHATRPSTVGIAVSSNPLSLLAWIGEKYLEWSDEDPDLDTILQTATLYWATETLPSSLYHYRQLFEPGSFGSHANPEWYIGKPLGFSSFLHEIAPTPASWVRTTGNLIFYRRHEKGGHFAAIEQPEVLWDDIAAFVQQLSERTTKVNISVPGEEIDYFIVYDFPTFYIEPTGLFFISILE
ncbi:epoxide hydrolase [Penicillium riverlandense]|uniref:epoxide hydrolase n=1 Tax=Penicillium riverlandense TaxID=1903569 RepID=UPI002548F0E7|nr:epoxide hydrolase [Penicillium riverlandense]KAJ5819033.1 epoxide hydrolase [Penicillium riverlandense]